MEKESMKNMLLAVISTLNGIELRTDQVQKSAKINACTMKLSEIVQSLDAKEEGTDEA